MRDEGRASRGRGGEEEGVGPAGPEDGPADRVEGVDGSRIEERLATGERAVAAWGNVVRTRRFVVTDDSGAERIVGEVVNGNAELRIELTGDRPEHSASVVIYACPDPDGLGSAVGVQLWAAGNAVAELNAWPGADGRWRSGVHIDDGSG